MVNDLGSSQLIIKKLFFSGGFLSHIMILYRRFCLLHIKLKHFCEHSEDSDDESPLEAQPYLMDGVGLVEGSIFELTQEYQLGHKVFYSILFLVCFCTLSLLMQ